VELYLHTPNMPLWWGAQLKHKDNFTLVLFTFTFTKVQPTPIVVKAKLIRVLHEEGNY